MNFFAELKRRNVYKVAVGYAVVGWLVMQVGATVVPALHLPDSITTTVVVLTMLGFPIALIIAWAFEMTPDGMKRTENVSPNEHIPQWSRRKFAVFIVVVGLVAAGLLFLQLLRQKGAITSSASTKSIAVLPFENLSRDPENAYFTDGIQDEILTRLAKIAELKVISRTSTERFKSSSGDLRQIARQLGVANILEGSVQKPSDQVRVNVQLIHAATDTHLWAETYDRKLTDVFAVESEISRAIAEKLQAKLTGSAEQVLAWRPTEDPEAHQLYMKGRYFWNKRNPENLKKAIEYFERAIAQDPAYALAYSGLADAHAVFPYYASTPPKDDARKALAAARKAVELDENLSEAHTSLANGLVLNLQYSASIPEPQHITGTERRSRVKDVSTRAWLNSGGRWIWIRCLSSSIAFSVQPWR